MWLYVVLPSLLLKELCTRVTIRKFNRLCGIDVYKVEKPSVCTVVAVRTSSWSRDDNRLVEFLTIHMLLTPLRLVLVLQYLISSSFMLVNTLVSRHDKLFVVYLLEPAINQNVLKKGPYIILESSTNKEDFYHLQTFITLMIQ